MLISAIRRLYRERCIRPDRYDYGYIKILISILIPGAPIHTRLSRHTASSAAHCVHRAPTRSAPLWPEPLDTDPRQAGDSALVYSTV